MKIKLTNTSIKALEASDKTLKVYDTNQAGFFVRISPKGVKTFALRYTSPIDGKDKTYSIGRYGQITLAEAQDIAKTKAGKVASGVDIQDEKKAIKAESLRLEVSTLGGFLNDKYEPYLLAERKSGKALIACIRTNFGEHENKQLTDINQWLITSWRNKRLQSGIAKATVNRNIGTLKAMLNKAIEWDVIDRNPLAKLKPLKTDNSPNVRYLNKTEEKQLRAALSRRDAKLIEERTSANKWRAARGYDLFPAIPLDGYGDHITPMVLLAMNTGMRRGELFSLTWSKANLSTKQLTIVGDTSKSGHTRYLPMTNEAVEVITKWKEQTPKPVGLVFPSPVTGKKMDNIKKGWGSVIDETNIESFRFHDLRHHFASQLVMRGVDLNTVRELLGHASLDMTLRYAHLAPEHKIAAMALLNE